MARLPRFNLPNIPQHVIQRGNNKQDTFLTEQDFTVYLSKLEEYSIKYNVAVHSFVLMTNHVHILATPSDEFGISKMMQSIGRYYVRYFNITHQRTGTLWEGRYKATIVDSELYFLTVSRYIELNPVRAKMVNKPSDYPWSSYHANALGKHINLITKHICYLSLAKTAVLQQQKYQSFFENELNIIELKEIRDATNKAWALGSTKFKATIEKQTGRNLTPSNQGGDRKSKKFKKDNINDSDPVDIG